MPFSRWFKHPKKNLLVRWFTNANGGRWLEKSDGRGGSVKLIPVGSGRRRRRARRRR